MKRIHRFSAVSLILILCLGLLGCGSAKNASSKSYEYSAPAAMADSYSVNQRADMGFDAADAVFEEPAEEESGLGTNGGAVNQTDPSRTSKIIYNASVTLETTEFEDVQERIARLVAEKGGFMESSRISGSNYNQIARGNAGTRSAFYTIRVPQESFDVIMNTLPEIGNVPYSEMSSRNVTRNYYDTEMRREAFQAQEKRLLEMLSAAETVKDMLAIQDQLTEVQYEIDSLSGTLRYYDDQVNYSTISLTVQEVREYTPQPTVKLSYWERMTAEFMDSLKATGEFFQNAFLWFVVSLPWLLPLALFIMLLVFLLRRLCRNSPALRARAERRAARKAERRLLKTKGEEALSGKDDPAP